jgi:hypothetical protein
MGFNEQGHDYPAGETGVLFGALIAPVEFGWHAENGNNPLDA